MFSEDFLPITPINFYQIIADCYFLPKGRGKKFPLLNLENFKKYLLPDTSSLCGEKGFAKIAIGWNREGLEFFLCVEHPFIRCSYPRIDEGDSLEVFIDTRDVKTAGFNTRFCHHFFFLFEPVEGCQAGELTRFRTEDAHPLCPEDALKVKHQKQERFHLLNAYIPQVCLHGYDPEQFNRLGFSYRVNRAEGLPQHFSVITEDYQIEQQPSLWASLKLVMS